MQSFPAIYSLHAIGKPVGKGSTAPFLGTVDAILKFDHAESPNAVYNEVVALRLGHMLNIPIADGVLVVTSDGHTYVSLQVGAPALPLPDLLPRQHARAAELYPNEAAALVAFDLLIGNRDRIGNVKASLISPHIPIIRGFDHGISLLNVSETFAQSIMDLYDGDLLVRFHPFYKHVRESLLDAWTTRIASSPDPLIDECCSFGRPFRGVNEDMQADLANALKSRKALLKKIISDNIDIVRPVA